MASCGYSRLLENSKPCGASVKNPEDAECISLNECTLDVLQHLKSCKVGTDSFEINEQTLLLSRAGKFLLL